MTCSIAQSLAQCRSRRYDDNSVGLRVQATHRDFLKKTQLTLVANVRGTSRRCKHSIISILIILLSTAGLAGASPKENQRHFVLPALTDRDIQIRSEDFTGQIVYLDFWSSWCAPCRDSLELLGRLQKQFKNSQFSVIAINLDRFPVDGRRVIEELDVSYPIASDIGWKVANLYGIDGVPAAFLIGKEGQVLSNIPELNENNFLKIVAAIDKELHE